ncbi:site-specific integrase [Pedobacter mucosus]|nr:site-specific integrase [Pedobacter mucosus]
MRITINGNPKEVSVGRACDPERWCSRSNREKGTKESTKLLNTYLDEIERQVEEAHTSMLKQRALINAESLKNKFLGIEIAEKKYMLLGLLNEHNRKMKELLGHDFKENTLKGYKTTEKHLKNFILQQYKTIDIDLLQLDYAFIADFNFYLKTVCNCVEVSAAKYIKHLKKIVNHAIKNKWLKENPFIMYKVKVKAKEREFLTQHQLDEITNKRLTIERLSQVRDIFLFCCYTGLAYADVKSLKRADIVTGVDGKSWIFTKREKNNNSCRIPLLKPALILMAKYAEHPKLEYENLVLPVLSNQKTNAYLKEIADICGITQNLTFHLARHTFATTVTLSNGVYISEKLTM